MGDEGIGRTHGMHVVHDGSAQAPPLLLIHGSGASGGFWNPVVPALAARHHVIRVDLPGCGRSQPAASYDVRSQAGRVADLLDALGVRGAAVAGHSSGGYVATAVAEARPDLVGSLALVSTGPNPEAFRRQPPVLRALTAPPLGRLLWAVRSDAAIRRWIAAMSVRPVQVPDDVVGELEGTTYRALRAVLRGNTAYISESSMPQRLAGLGIPLLVVFGGADPRWEPASAHTYAVVPGARVAVLPGVGHLPMAEAPGATAQLLLDFTAQR
ncbi:alpha/beta fold hydrolase [Actinacidiphila bryophytorum]|uniref:alpha/beta fold hydrolase n=1 Tax=Actinacidiphila bryophytorum TaxID=1436133 RepID=UPI002176D52A|nr:alpha/beta hydrolase [Actinacidiphila bryophytorum]UWE11016.1 alpha/beta hydrolase [Actinacidiphila bryophytorum]